MSLKGAYDAATFTPDCSPEGIRSSIDEALTVLDGCKPIDLFECARVDPKIPIETTVQTLSELITEGKIGSYGLSEVSCATIRRAHAVHPPAAVEIELSRFSRHVLQPGGVAETCRELEIPLVAYSPLDRGWLTGQLKRLEDLPAGDYRHQMPRFQPGAFEQNVRLAEKIEELGRQRGLTAPQVALAWVRQQGALPIPGATKKERVVENCREVILSETEMDKIRGFLEEIEVKGERYPEVFQELLSL